MSSSRPASRTLADARVSPVVALSLLQGLKAVDTPPERLEDEDLRQSLPRRLGLSRAVESQIERYRDLKDRKTPLEGQELADLFVLVARRPDAETVFREAGRWLSRRHLDRRKIRTRVAGATLPAALRGRVALRVARSVAEQVSPVGSARSEMNPMALVLEGSLPALACQSPAGCELLRQALRSILSAHGFGGADDPPEVVHPLCEAQGDSCCVWRTPGKD